MEKAEVQRAGDVYREIKAGAVFRAERGPKRSELAPGVYVDTPAENSVRYVARRTAKGGFGWLLYQLAVDGGLEQAKQVVMLGDGAPWIGNLAAEHFPGVGQIVDLYHAKEHVWDVATWSFDAAQQGERPGPRTMARCWKRGRVKRSSPRSRCCRPYRLEPGQLGKIPARAVDYLTTNGQRMRYPVFRAQGMHIGRGIAEAD